MFDPDVEMPITQSRSTPMSDLTIEQLEHYKILMEPTPPFLDALIAEKRAHAELRKRIEERIRELKQPLCSYMPEGDELDDYLEQWGRQSHEVEILTEILEGDDEGDMNTGGLPW